MKKLLSFSFAMGLGAVAQALPVERVTASGASNSMSAYVPGPESWSVGEGVASAFDSVESSGQDVGLPSSVGQRFSLSAVSPLSGRGDGWIDLLEPSGTSGPGKLVDFTIWNSGEHSGWGEGGFERFRGGRFNDHYTYLASYVVEYEGAPAGVPNGELVVLGLAFVLIGFAGFLTVRGPRKAKREA